MSGTGHRLEVFGHEPAAHVPGQVRRLWHVQGHVFLVLSHLCPVANWNEQGGCIFACSRLQGRHSTAVERLECRHAIACWSGYYDLSGIEKHLQWYD